MVYKLKNIFGRKLVAFVLIFSFISSNLYLPIFGTTFIPKAEAAGLPVIDLPEWAKRIIDGIAMSMAQKMVDDVVKSTIDWANEGFDGNPAYITDPGSFFETAAHDAAVEFITDDTNFGYLCSPIQAQIQLSMTKYSMPERRTSCSLEDIGTNLTDFYNDFNEGGWEAWLKLTQDSSNNPYGGFLETKSRLDKQMAKQIGLKNLEYSANQGFRNFATCSVRNPNFIPPDVRQDYEDFGLSDPNVQGWIRENGRWDPTKPDGACIEGGPIATAGATIKTQLDKTLSSGLDTLVTVKHIEGLIGAFASGLLTRFVFSEHGTFSDRSSVAVVNEIIDVDDDNIPDGYDTDDDGDLDICHHGSHDQNLPPSNENCIKSSEAVNSPFFVPICEATAETIRGLESYLRFLDDEAEGRPTYTAFSGGRSYQNIPRIGVWPRKDDYRIWQNRTMDAHNVVENFIDTISRFEIRAYSPIINNFGQYSKRLETMIESLITSRDLRNDGLPSDDNVTIWQTTNYTRDRLAYLLQFQSDIGQCDNPDEEALGSIPLPEEVPDADGGGGGGNEDDETTDDENTPPEEDEEEPEVPAGLLSCTPQSTNVNIDEETSWLVVSTYPTGTEYTWSGDDFDSETMNTAENLPVTYETTGTKTAQIEAEFENGATLTRVCVPSIFVSNEDPDQ